jgi:hypothetical protein
MMHVAPEAQHSRRTVVLTDNRLTEQLSPRIIQDDANMCIRTTIAERMERTFTSAKQSRGDARDEDAQIF